MIYYQFVFKGSAVKIPPEFTQYKCLILNEYKIDEEYRWTVREHLVETGCRWMLAWGIDGTLWDDSVDLVEINKFLPEIVGPDDEFVLTTWHDNDTLEEVIHFTKFGAVETYDAKPLHDVVIIDLSEVNREEYISGLYSKMEQGDH